MVTLAPPLAVDSIVKPPAVTLLMAILFPAVISMSSLPLPDPPAVNLRFTLLPEATDD